jgi:hypothetical protein
MAIRFTSLILLAIPAFGQVYTASTSAGIFVPENLAGTSVSLNSIGGVAVDVWPATFSSRSLFTPSFCDSTPPP